MLKIPEILKVSLKKIKELFNFKTEQNNNAEDRDETEKASEIFRDGGEEHGENEN